MGATAWVVISAMLVATPLIGRCLPEVARLQRLVVVLGNTTEGCRVSDQRAERTRPVCESTRATMQTSHSPPVPVFTMEPSERLTQRFDQLYRQTHGQVYAVAFALNRGSAQDAWDATQDAFVAALRKPDVWRSTTPEEFVKYVLATLTKQRVSFIRRQQVQRRALERLRDGALEAAIQSVEQAVLANEALQAIVSLPPKQSAVVLLRVVHGYSAQDIAEILHVAPTTVRTHLQRALCALRRRLGDHEESSTTLGKAGDERA